MTKSTTSSQEKEMRLSRTKISYTTTLGYVERKQGSLTRRRHRAPTICQRSVNKNMHSTVEKCKRRKLAVDLNSSTHPHTSNEVQHGRYLLYSSLSLNLIFLHFDFLHIVVPSVRQRTPHASFFTLSVLCDNTKQVCSHEPLRNRSSSQGHQMTDGGPT